MRISRTLVLPLVTGAVLAAPGVASAEPYPAPPTNVTVSSGLVETGEAVTFTATGGFIPGEPISVTISYSGGTGSRGTAAGGMAGRAETGSGPRVVGAALPARLIAGPVRPAALTGVPALPAEVPARAAAVRTVANSGGGFSVEVELDGRGTAILTATGLTSGYSVSKSVAVVAENTAVDGDGDGDLPVTGASGLRLALQVGAGAATLFLGVLLVWLTTDRRRRNGVRA